MHQNKPDTLKNEEVDYRIFKMGSRHKMVLESVKPDPLYEKAFLSVRTRAQRNMLKIRQPGIKIKN